MQSNAIIERIHQVLAECLTTFKLVNLNIDKEDNNPFEEYLTMALSVIQFGFHKTYRHSPGHLVFGCDRV